MVVIVVGGLGGGCGDYLHDEFFNPGGDALSGKRASENQRAVTEFKFDDHCLSVVLNNRDHPAHFGGGAVEHQ